MNKYDQFHAKRPYIPYILPFALFAVCTYIGPLFSVSQALMYPVKTIVVAFALILFAVVGTSVFCKSGHDFSAGRPPDARINGYAYT